MATRSSPAMSLGMWLQNHMRSWLQTPNQQEYSSRENGQSIEGTEGERSQGDHPLGNKRRPTAAGRASILHRRSVYLNQDTDVRR
jgi:hypothetical protein